ncbi:Putative inorganic phosphate cotransporter [Araneus ventricosus]|uniref:Inorganic phosphate cotransporter n=1 Tax=Araneus ventricosus TaxID=182803 RepID=A0A4Y2NUQ9_ARAVE|nr:Putative inorganic phosphate cotransporter [Araneus ventricosus]
MKEMPNIANEACDSKRNKCDHQIVNKLDESSISADLAKSDAPAITTKQKSVWQSLFQCRYIVTLLEFFVFFEIDAYRLATSMSVVAMVNNTAISSNEDLNFTIESCPINYSFTAENSLPDNDGEFNWSPEIQGYVLGAGFMGYVISQIPGGLLAEAYGAKITIVGGLFLSSVAHVLCPFAAWYSSYLMIGMQLLRGLGQGLLPPAHSVLSANWFPSTERGFLNGLIMAGSVVGSLVSCFFSGALCSSTLLGGWPSVYYIYGGLGLVLCLCVHFCLFESPRVHPRIEKLELNYIIQNQETDLSQKRPPTPWRKILTSVPVYAMTYAVFSHFWAITHQISVQPVYLGSVLHYPIQENGVLTSIPFIFQALLIFIGGWISKWLITQNYIGIDKARKWCTLLYSLGYSVGVLGIYFAGCDRVWSNVFSIIAMSFIGLSVPGCMVAPIDMSPTFAGSLFGLSNTIASSASFLLPVITGLMLNEEQTLAQWNNIFFMCTAVIMSAGIVFYAFGSAEVQPWNFQESSQKTRL